MGSPYDQLNTYEVKSALNDAFRIRSVSFFNGWKTKSLKLSVATHWSKKKENNKEINRKDQVAFGKKPDVSTCSLT